MRINRQLHGEAIEVLYAGDFVFNLPRESIWSEHEGTIQNFLSTIGEKKDRIKRISLSVTLESFGAIPQQDLTRFGAWRVRQRLTTEEKFQQDVYDEGTFCTSDAWKEFSQSLPNLRHTEVEYCASNRAGTVATLDMLVGNPTMLEGRPTMLADDWHAVIHPLSVPSQPKTMSELKAEYTYESVYDMVKMICSLGQTTLVADEDWIKRKIPHAIWELCKRLHAKGNLSELSYADVCEEPLELEL